MDQKTRPHFFCSHSIYFSSVPQHTPIRISKSMEIALTKLLMNSVLSKPLVNCFLHCTLCFSNIQHSWPTTFSFFTYFPHVIFLASYSPDFPPALHHSGSVTLAGSSSSLQPLYVVKLFLGFSSEALPFIYKPSFRVVSHLILWFKKLSYAFSSQICLSRTVAQGT